MRFRKGCCSVVAVHLKPPCPGLTPGRHALLLLPPLPQGAEAEPDALRHAVPRENYGFGQEVVQYVQRQSGSSSSSGSGSGSKSASNSGSRFLGIGGGGGSGRQPLRVRFMQRDSGGRQLLNIAELVAACNAWRFTPPGGGPPLTADCRQVRMGLGAQRGCRDKVGMAGVLLPAKPTAAPLLAVGRMLCRLLPVHLSPHPHPR